MPDEVPALVLVGRVRRSHGVHGVVVVQILADSPELIFVPGRRLLGESDRSGGGFGTTELHVVWAEPFQDGLRVRFEEIAERDVADSLRGLGLLLPRQELPEPDSARGTPGDLIGLLAVRENGDAIGTVTAYYELPHDLLFEVTRTEGGTVLIPYREEFVSRLDAENREIVISPPEGLL